MIAAKKTSEYDRAVALPRDLRGIIGAKPPAPQTHALGSPAWR